MRGCINVLSSNTVQIACNRWAAEYSCWHSLMLLIGVIYADIFFYGNKVPHLRFETGKL